MNDIWPPFDDLPPLAPQPSRWDDVEESLKPLDPVLLPACLFVLGYAAVSAVALVWSFWA